MAKSYSRRKASGWKDLWSPRPMRWQPSTKVNKVLCHRIERAQELTLIQRELKSYYADE